MDTSISSVSFPRKGGRGGGCFRGILHLCSFLRRGGNLGSESSEVSCLPFSPTRGKEGRVQQDPVTDFLSLGNFRGSIRLKGIPSRRVGLACPSAMPKHGRSLTLLRSPKGPFPHIRSFNDPKVVSRREMRIRIRGRSNDSPTNRIVNRSSTSLTGLHFQTGSHLSEKV